MPTRHADAVWEGGLRDGNGRLELESGAYEGEYSFSTRFEDEPGTNPEELIGAAHAGCFSMALSGALNDAGYEPERIETHANVHLERADGGFEISLIELETEASVPDIDDDTFQEHARGAKENCPVSKALAGVEIELTAKLV